MKAKKIETILSQVIKDFSIKLFKVTKLDDTRVWFVVRDVNNHHHINRFESNSDAMLYYFSHKQ